MSRPESLPAKVFLLSYDIRRQRLTGRGELGCVLRAAALAELLLHGQLVDDAGKPRATTAPSSEDPLLTAVWEQIAHGSPRSWRRWVGKDQRHAVGLVLDRLAADGTLRVEPRRVLGVFPGRKLTLRQHVFAKRLGEQVTGAVKGAQAASRVDRDIGVLAALAAAGRLRLVLNTIERRRCKARITELGKPAKPVVTALRKTIDAKHAAAAAG
ncbi:GOLPH3/VPS74 family protein [Amycolatopsis nigrescens]|uniref:GOLPH3/VPS74 family protein n=1 Tax=Amycolatopsis nigrescens TaxID=381445 RepID=UPI00037F4752|nr:GPP34 family phosphoprotein [Amycolatopsis nigrescens]